MLDMPRRSVTRFFIPLIDVLTLLFCVFLVMPLAKSSNEDAAPSTAEELKKLQAELDRLRSIGAEEPEKIRKELEELRKAKADVLKDRIVPRILEIDGSDGKLYYQGAKGRVELVGAAGVRDLIEGDRRRFGDKSEVVYILQYPRDPNSDYPTLADEEKFKTWLKDVPLRSDAPWEKGALTMLLDLDLSWLPDGPTYLPIQILTVIGITAAGALLVGLLPQIVCRMVIRAKAPGPAVNLFRLGGAAAAGIAAVLWLWGPGLGRGKGKGDGSGNSNGNAKATDPNGDPKKVRDDKTPKPEVPAGKDILRIEVLGNITLRKIAGDDAVNNDRRFRIPSVSTSKLLTLGEVKNYISQRSRDGMLPDQLNLIFYKLDTRPKDKDLALNGTDMDGLQALAHDLGKDKVQGGWIKSDTLDQTPPIPPS